MITFRAMAPVAALLFSSTLFAGSYTFNGAPDNQYDAAGYYYALSSSKLVNGQTQNGTNGALYYITDDPIWGQVIDTWHQDYWFTGNTGLAVTMKDGASVVYDNNGIETSSDSGYYLTPEGRIVGYSMANNYDWIYAGAVTIAGTTEVTDIISYFNRNGYPSDFDPSNGWSFRMNIFSTDANGAPVNTGSFTGDVFSSDNTSGEFSWSDTGLYRPPCSNPDPVTGCGTLASPDNRAIWRLVYHLDNPISLSAGNYYFSSDAVLTPEPASVALIGGALGALVLLRRRLARR